MPFRERAVVELVNESDEPHGQYFYVDYETLEAVPPETRATSTPSSAARIPSAAGGPRSASTRPEANAVNTERQAWDNNYVILETQGRGHYIGCNLSVTNFQGTWWGEGDDMIWVDGYKWPPDLHGTGSEDYLNQAWGMQPNAFLRNGSSIFEGHTIHVARDRAVARQRRLPDQLRLPPREPGALHAGDQGHHRARPRQPPGQRDEQRGLLVCRAARRGGGAAARAQRLPVLRDNQGTWLHDPERQCPGKPVVLTDEMRTLKARAAGR